MSLRALLYLLLPLTFAIPMTFHARTTTVTHVVDGSPLDCTSGSIGIDPSIPISYIDQFCSTVSASQPDWLIKVTNLPQGNVNLIYAWEAAGNDYTQTCSTKCVKAFNDIILTCEFDSHTINGEGTFTEACGEFILEITPEVG